MRQGSVELVVVGDRVSLDAMRRLVPVCPTRSFSKGDEVVSKAGKRYQPWGLWAIKVEEDDIDKAALRLLELVEPFAPAIMVAADELDAQMRVAVTWQPEGGQGGFSMPSEILSRLAALAPLFDFYFS